MVGKKKLADDRRHLWEQVSTYVRSHGNPSTQQGRAAHLFKFMAGDFPPYSWRVDTTQDVPVSKNVLNKIRQKTMAYVKARERGQVPA